MIKRYNKYPPQHIKSYYIFHPGILTNNWNYVLLKKNISQIRFNQMWTLNANTVQGYESGQYCNTKHTLFLISVLIVNFKSQY